MVEIEFVDPGAGEDADEAPYEDDAGPDLRRWLPALAAGVAWVGAAGLAVMASLSVVYRLHYHASDADEKVSVDAWGRYNPSSLADGLGHTTRFAIVLVGAAIILFAAAMLTIPRLSLARYVGVAGLSAAAASAATLFLNVEATRATYAAQRANTVSNATGSSGAAGTLHVQFGAASWLAAGSVLLAVAGLVLAFVLRVPEPSAPPSAHAQPPAPPEPSAPEFEPST